MQLKCESGNLKHDGVAVSVLSLKPWLKPQEKWESCWLSGKKRINSVLQGLRTFSAKEGLVSKEPDSFLPGRGCEANAAATLRKEGAERIRMLKSQLRTPGRGEASVPTGTDIIRVEKVFWMKQDKRGTSTSDALCPLLEEPHSPFGPEEFLEKGKHLDNLPHMKSTLKIVPGPFHLGR